jgi:aminopeptidase C
MTDDHGMLITGIAKDQNGNEYYLVKNSWGTDQKFKGYFYASKPFVLMNTLDIMVHRDAIPKHIREKLGLK